jgi:hypothetical protein
MEQTTEVYPMSTPTIWLREGELFVRLLDTEPHVCVYCGQPIVRAMCKWPDEPDYWGQVHELQFPVWRHADGSPSHDHGGMWNVLPAPHCPNCHANNTLDAVQEAYGDRTTCSACGWHHWYDIGD